MQLMPTFLPARYPVPSFSLHNLILSALTLQEMAVGAKYIKAVGIAVGLWRLADSIWHVGDAVKEGMQGHMSVEIQQCVLR